MDAGRELDRAIEMAGSMRRFAAKHGFSPTYVSEVAGGRKPFGPRILKALGLRKHTHTIYMRDTDPGAADR